MSRKNHYDGQDQADLDKWAAEKHDNRWFCYRVEKSGPRDRDQRLVKPDKKEGRRS